MYQPIPKANQRAEQILSIILSSVVHLTSRRMERGSRAISRQFWVSREEDFLLIAFVVDELIAFKRRLPTAHFGQPGVTGVQARAVSEKWWIAAPCWWVGPFPLRFRSLIMTNCSHQRETFCPPLKSLNSTLLLLTLSMEEDFFLFLSFEIKCFPTSAHKSSFHLERVHRQGGEKQSKNKLLFINIFKCQRQA